MCAQRAQVAKGSRPLGEHAALHAGQAMGARRAEHAHAAGGVVARQHHHLHPLLVWCVEGEQLAYQRKSHAWRSGGVQPLQLQLHVGPCIALIEQAVFFLEIKQGARGNRHHQLVVQGLRHRGAYFMNWLSSMMGCSTASTISSTTRPMVTISRGSSKVASCMERRWTSVENCWAARCSITGNWPVCSPRRANMGNRLGKRFFCARAEARGAPSRTMTRASSASARRARLFSVSAAACSALRMGTPAPASMASVPAKRAA